MSPGLLDLISLRSFSSIWYWLAVAVFWGQTMQTPLGVPESILRAARGGHDGSRSDAAALARVFARRRLALNRMLGAWRLAIWSCMLTVLAGLGLFYRVELAQAFLLMAAPGGLAALLTDSAARRVIDDEVAGVVNTLERLRHRLQGVGLAAVFVTAVWGSLHVLARYVP